MFYLWKKLVELTTAMFCCGRLEEEEDSMAQGTARLKTGKEKRLTEAKGEEERGGVSGVRTTVQGGRLTDKAQVPRHRQQHHTTTAPPEISHKASEQPSKSHSTSSSKGQERQSGGKGSATTTPPKDRKSRVRTSSASPKASPRHEGRGNRAPNNGGFEMGIKKSEIMDDSSVVQTVEILKRPGQTLGFYIREGNGMDRQDGVFISRIQMGTVAESNGLLHVGDEILTVNNVTVTKMSLDDVVILMSIPKKLVLTIRTKKNCNKNASCPALASTDIEEQPPIVVLKKGRSSSATALEMTEKCPDDYSSTSSPNQQRDYSSAYTQTPPKKEPAPPPPRSSKPPSYASIFISPQRAEARLLRDDSVDSTVSSHTSEGSVVRGAQHIRDQPYVGRYGWHTVDINIDSPQTSASGAGAPSAHYHSDTAAGDREYLKYSLGEGGYRKMPPRSASLSGRTTHISPDYCSDSELRALYGESYANVHAIRDYASHKGYYDAERDRGRSQDKALRGLLHAKTKYGRLPRSHSPECYNSDSEVAAYLQSRRADPRGFASDHETYTGAGGFTSTSSDYTDQDDNDVIYSIPRIPASSSSELQQLLQKFNTLSQELQQEQSKLQRQLSAKKQRVPLSLPRSSGTPSDTEEYSSATLSGASTRGSPSPSRRATSAQTTASTLQPRMVRKHSADSLLSYMTYQMEDRLDSSQEQQQQQHPQPHKTKSVMQSPKGGRVSKSSTVGALSPDKTRMYDTDGKSLAKSASRYKDLYLIKKPLQLDYEEYEPYKADLRKRLELDRIAGLDGMLGVHILTGQGLKSSRTTLRDLYCVVAIDNENKARTMIRTGAVNFDWDECFDLELDNSKELSFLVYNWDPNFRHRLCFHGSVLLPGLGEKSRNQKLAVYMEPKGILYVEMAYKEPAISLQRLPSQKKNALFGVDLETVIRRENSGLQVPILVKKCIDEIEARGLESVGIYRLCGSAKRKAELRTAFEINPKAVDLSPDHVSDIHVVTGVLKDYLRELPEPLVTNALYQMLLDALSVRLPDDPDGSAKLMLSILECLPKANQDTMSLVLNHLRKIASKSEANKMTVSNLAVCFGPVLLCPAPSSMAAASFPVELKKHIEVLKYLLEIWADDDGDMLSVTDQASVSSDTRASPKPPSDVASVGGQEPSAS